MARKKNRWWVWLLIIIIACAGAFVCAMLCEKEEEQTAGTQEQCAGCATSAELTVIDTEIEYKQDSCTIDLIKGTVKTNEQVDAIFVNINGVGTQYLKFTASKVTTDSGAYVLQTIESTNSLCATGFAADTTLTVDVYVEYGGRSYKVDTQEVGVLSCWSLNY